MVFSSIPFLFAFLPAVLLIYYLVPLKWRNFVLLVFSLLFYGWGEPIYVFVMIGSIAMDYFFGIMIEKHRGDRRKARTFLALSVLLNLLIFFFFKYLDFCIENLRLIPGLQNLRPLGITLPIGISFYTFQKMSYVIDVYRGVGRVQKNIVYFFTYISMFPH
jgi:alginate O-acetyltransferase complex protein AlgI